MSKRKAEPDGPQAKEEAPMPALTPEQTLAASPDLVNSYGMRIFERADGKWAMVLEKDGETVRVTDWQIKRLFNRDYHRGLAKLADLVFKGAVRSVT